MSATPAAVLRNLWHMTGPTLYAIVLACFVKHLQAQAQAVCVSQAAAVYVLYRAIHGPSGTQAGCSGCTTVLCSEEDWNNSSTLEDEPYMLSKVGAWSFPPACHHPQLHTLSSAVHALLPGGSG